MRIAYGWACMQAGCDAAGAGPASYREADKHTTSTSHSTRTWGVPEEDAT